MDLTNQEITTFTSNTKFFNITKLNTCFKTSIGTCVDLILTIA